MDTSIRSLLVAAQKISGQEKNPALLQAYSLLRNVAENKPTVDNPEAFSPDLYVQCAEIAFQNGLFDISKECLKMYFMKPPPGNQFLCRAYLCQSQLLAPKATIPEQLEKAVVYLLKAISFAKGNPRYHFLVYNASVIYWQFCRPFLKQNFRQFLARSLHSVVKALDDIDDKDYEWRAQLMIALIECNLDAGKKNDAAQIASAAAAFIKQNVPHLYKQVFGLIIRNQLIDSSKFHKDIKASPELGIFYMICKLKVSLENNEPKEYYAEIQRILNQMGVPHSESHTKKKKGRTQSPSSVTDPDSDLMSREVSELSLPDSLKGKSPAPKLKNGDLRKALLSEKTNESLKSRSRSPAVRTSREGSTVKQKTHRESDRKSPTKGTGRRTPTPTSTKKISAESQEKPYLLLELARLCLELDFPDLAQDCADHMKTCNVKDQGFYLELEFLQCDIMVKHLAEKQESLHKHVVDIRQQAIKRCEEVIMNAIRLGNPNVIQVGCVTQWNLCLPLLQPNLRHHVRKPLTLVAEALENIQSLLVQLRCQVHTELAKCEEDVEQIEVAMTNLKKALALDDAKIYQERLEVMLHRLELRSELYKQPERVEDIAGMIIEQARKANSGTMRMKRSLLVKAGEALAPDAFNLVLDSESSTKALELALGKNSNDVPVGKAPLTQIKKLANKARQFNKCVKKAEGHLQRLGNENDRERARLWGDLAKTARKQEVWDVCRVASRFCLLYDDGRWKNIIIEKDESPKPPEKSKTADSNVADGTQSAMDRSSTQLTQQDGGRSDSPTPQSSLYDKDLLRMFAEVNFIQGEAMVHLLRTEGVQLNDAPIPPVDTRKHPKGYVAKKPEEDPDWIEYCDWIKSLSECGTSSFLRGLALGVELNEAWLVCCATTYVWNYNNHVLTQLRHREIMDTLTVVFDGLKNVGHANETSSLVNVCNALSYALMKPWIPVSSKETTPPESPGRIDSGKKGKADPKAKKSTTNMVTIASEAMPDLKKAIEPWTEGQRAMSRSIVAVEMLKLNKNNIMEFKEVPPIAEVANMVEECRWTDKFVELQLWSHLTSLAYDQKMHSLVMRCSKKALRFATTGTQPKTKKIDGHSQMVEFEMLSYSSGILGQSLVDNMGGKNAIRRESLSAFLNSARFAMKADNYELVMTAARHYWNTCCPLVSQPIERELLREPIRIILQCITETADSQKKKEEKTDDEKKDEELSEEGVGEIKEKEEKTVGGIGAVEDDLTLRAALYGVLFQSFADKGEWEAGLQAMDQAITDMPRTKHRLLIFKHRVITKAKLGRSVAMDIQKFKNEMRYLNSSRSKKKKDESEDYVAHMWRRVALMSKETAEQLLSYQNAIEALNSQSNEWLKIELLLEFAQWLCVKDFPLEDCTDQVEWAIDMMQNMQADIDARKEEEAKAAAEAAEAKKATKGGKKDKKGAPPPKPKVPSAKKERTQVKDSIKEKEGKDKGDGTGSDINAEDIVPQAREAVIGVLPTNPSLKIQEITDIKVLDGLIRAHVLLAEIVGRGLPQYADYLLMAHAYLMKLWQVTVKVSGPTMKEILKNPPQAIEKDPKGSAKKKDKGAEKAPVKEKPKRKGPLDVIPNTLEEWAVYDVPDEVIEAFKHEMMEETGINKHTIVKPMLTLHYLESMVTQLRDIGYNHLTLPILAFEDLLSRDLLQNDSLKFLVHNRALEVCLELNLTNGYTFHEKIVGPVNINDADQAKEKELAKLADIPEEDESGGGVELDKHSRQFLKYAKQIRQMKSCDSVSRQYLIQATECLLQTLLLALSKKYTDIAAVAALELVECFGQYDPVISTQFLALYQSCNISVRLNDLLHRAQLDPIQSKLAALLRQRENLLTKDVSYNTGASSVMTTVQNALENDWQAWKKMDILSNHMDILKELPSNFNFIVLQHSPDKKFLYGAVMDKPKGTPAAGGGDKKGNPKQGAPAPSRAKVFGMETSRAELEALLSKCREHRQNVQQLLVKQEYQRSQAAMRRKMLENLDDSMKSQKPKTLVDESEKEERHLQDEFRDLVMAIEMYLKPITAQFDGILVPPVPSPSTSVTEKPGREPKEPPPPPQEYAILLADPELMELPLEALKVFQVENIISLTRDFSLQLFYHRYHQDTPEASHAPSKKGEAPKSAAPKSGKSAHGQGSEDTAAAAAKKAKSKGGDQPFSRIPGLRDASKKMAKIIPLNRPLNPWNVPVDTMNFRFIVDPHLDCAETEENKPIDVFNKVLEDYEQQFTPRWLGVMGNEHTPSVGEWEVYLLENSAFVFYGMERLLSYIPPAKLSALNIPECMIVYSLDMAQTTKSFTRQSKIDVLKSSKVLPLEKPVETAMLTSLTGIKCILGNQWHCTLAENAAKLNTNMKDLLEGGMSTGEAIRMLFTPYRRKIPVTESGEGEEDTGGESDKKEDETKSMGDGSVTDRSQASDKTSTTVQEYKENIDIQRSWFNFVCYGLPNIVVTQL
ncbi:cilia- and flagella-associated protein 46-like [Mercenaria mercenaria]|uniref:cilia- and flagella-associated protein 46-like n=1 Tax=Mercenaria mercenaria TaxID=6596 RepID=UPI00234FAE06|nr:cilia- and flagella-associated protein 46-like [Mercenaria mercenaria]